MMIKKLLVLSISLTFAYIPTTTALAGSISAGQSKAASCAGCHGEDGNSMVSTFPKLAGQHEGYLVQQLLAFKDGSRNAPMMAPLAMGLNKESIEDISAYYASKRTSTNQQPVLMANDDDEDDDESEMSDEQKTEEINRLITLGADLYRNGNLETEVSACIACHGPSGEGNRPASFPALKGQHSDYLITALSDFKKGSRSNQSDNIMHMISKKMSDEEITAVSYYISTVK